MTSRLAGWFFSTLTKYVRVAAASEPVSHTTRLEPLPPLSPFPLPLLIRRPHPHARLSPSSCRQLLLLLLLVSFGPLLCPYPFLQVLLVPDPANIVEPPVEGIPPPRSFQQPHLRLVSNANISLLLLLLTLVPRRQVLPLLLLLFRSRRRCRCCRPHSNLDLHQVVHRSRVLWTSQRRMRERVRTPCREEVLLPFRGDRRRRRRCCRFAVVVVVGGRVGSGEGRRGFGRRGEGRVRRDEQVRRTRRWVVGS